MVSLKCVVLKVSIPVTANVIVNYQLCRMIKNILPWRHYVAIIHYSGTLVFVQGIHMWPGELPAQWRGKCFHLMTSSWNICSAGRNHSVTAVGTVGFRNEHCDRYNQFVCKKLNGTREPISPTTTNAPPEESYCPTGYTAISSKGKPNMGRYRVSDFLTLLC